MAQIQMVEDLEDGLNSFAIHILHTALPMYLNQYALKSERINAGF